MLIESNKRLSDSVIWNYQREYFKREGIQAWNTVPYYVTSNPLLAKGYAQTILGFLRDCYNSLVRDAPIYIVELGAGSGCFSYYFLRCFFDCLQLPFLKTLKIRYVMTDISSSLLDFWREQPCFQPFIAAGQLEFSLFDMAEPHLLQLPKMDVNPLITIANYLFDSIAQDMFYYKKTQLCASLVSTRNDSNQLSEDVLTHCELSFSRHPINLPYYTNPHWNNLLANYFGLLENKAILFPVAALNGIDHLMTLSRKRLLLLCADKGFHQIDKVATSEEPPLIIHGSISFDVNFHLLEQYILLNGGLAKHMQHYTNGLHISMFILGDEINHYKETLQSYYDWIENFNSYDFFKIKKYLERMASSLNIEEILAFLRLSGWDEKIYTILLPYLKSYELYCTPEEKQAIRLAVERVQQWQYALPQNKNLV